MFARRALTSLSSSSRVRVAACMRPPVRGFGGWFEEGVKDYEMHKEGERRKMQAIEDEYNKEMAKEAEEKPAKMAAFRKARKEGEKLGYEPAWMSGGSIVGVPDEGEKISVTFVNMDGKKLVADCQVGQPLIDVAYENDVELGQWPCNSHLSEAEVFGQEPSCTSCHMIISKSYWKHLPKAFAGEEEQLFWTENRSEGSRLACCIKLTKEMDGMVIGLPDKVNVDY